MPPKSIQIIFDIPKDEDIPIHEKLLTKFIKQQIKSENLDINAGDVIKTEVNGYRNSGKYMWDGKNVIDLYYGYDDYGSVPPVIQITDNNDFTPNSWKNLIVHNNLIFFSKAITDRLKFRLDSGNGGFIAETMIRNQKYVFKVVYETENYENIHIYTLSN